MRCGRHEEGDGEEGDGHEAPPRHEEEGRAGGGADEGDAEEVSLSWAELRCLTWATWEPGLRRK